MIMVIAMGKKPVLAVALGLILILSLVAIVAGLWLPSLSNDNPNITPTPTAIPTSTQIPTPTYTPTATPSPTPTLSPIVPVPTMQVNNNRSVTITLPYRMQVNYTLPWISSTTIFYYGMDQYNSTYLDIRSPSGFPDQGFPAKQGVYTALWGDQITVLEVYPTYLVVQIEHTP
jgi:hypothetical protein